ncbi:GAF domain-containing protein [Methanospirillum lacunae]|uniref:Histidine kinase n=1 Tax=Methanospirillum lacunae TaxID=668570 RepID=A0A2V2ND05_9EURY|nr:GAF domain-containing protein [Methanospirillum lacunae]PWR74237.1 histidine kinase [Methanospirillum lacunae]
MDSSLSETERLIVSYLQTHSPEECMLDKISLGIGKSRATVLKYLNTLYALSILDFKIIGRNKLWLVRDSSVPSEKNLQTIIAQRTQNNFSSLVSQASELHDLTLRRLVLSDSLDNSDQVILTINSDYTIISANQEFQSVFPDTYSIRDIILPEKLKQFDHAIRAAFLGEEIELTLELQEKPGIIRLFRLSLFPSKEKKNFPYLVIIGEDISFHRTQKKQETLLYLIRSAVNIESRDELLSLMMTGIQDSLLSYRQGLVLLSNHTLIYKTAEVTPAGLQELTHNIDKAASLCETQIITLENPGSFFQEFPDNSDLKYLIIVPLLEGEQTIGSILLFTDHEVNRVNVEYVEIIADEIANFLKVQRLEHERSELIHSLEAINRISEILNTDGNEASLLGNSIDSAMEILGFDVGCVYLMDEDMALTPAVQRNMPDRLRDLCMSGHFSSLFDKACQRNSVLYIIKNSPEFAALGPDIEQIGVKTILVLPIRVGNTILGLLNMGSREEKIYYKGSLDNISSLGMQLGIALERTRLAHAAISGNHV